MMQQRRQQQRPSQCIFTASEVADFEYCPLAWWHDQYEPLAHADIEELFARMVELEHEHSSQAPTLPEYRMVEQLLVRREAFDEGLQQHLEHAKGVAKIEQEHIGVPNASGTMRCLLSITLALLVVALLLIAASLVLVMR